MTSLLLTAWSVLGFVAFFLLHRIPAWPNRVWFGWTCFVLCGPFVWIFFVLMWAIEGYNPFRTK